MYRRPKRKSKSHRNEENVLIKLLVLIVDRFFGEKEEHF